MHNSKFTAICAAKLRIELRKYFTPLKHIAIDNFYFERAKKLLQAIEANSAEQLRKFERQPSDDGAEDGRLPMPNPYRTEH